MAKISTLRPSPTALLNPRYDANFKAIFTQNTKESRIALKSFLSAAIGRKVKEVFVTENEEPKTFDLQRGVSYDINCVFDDDSSAQVEMQGFDRQYNYGKRAEYYASRLVSATLEVGDDWDKVAQAYQISVLNFKYDMGNENPIHHYTMLDPTDGARLSGRLNVIFLELPKLPEFDENTDIDSLPSIIKWCKFLQKVDDTDARQQSIISKIARSEEGIMEAEATLNKISQDRWRWIIQGQIEGRERDIISGINAAERRGIAQGIAQGISQGEHKKAIETAKNMLKMNLGTKEQIAQITGLNLEEINSL